MSDYTRCECGGRWVSSGGCWTTLVGFSSPPGHDHDDNCKKTAYQCENGHTTTFRIRNRCDVPGCGWVGKEACFCHKGPLVDAWPVADIAPSASGRP